MRFDKNSRTFFELPAQEVRVLLADAHMSQVGNHRGAHAFLFWLLFVYFFNFIILLYCTMSFSQGCMKFVISY
jgi:hypothetical protein